MKHLLGGAKLRKCQVCFNLWHNLNIDGCLFKRDIISSEILLSLELSLSTSNSNANVMAYLIASIDFGRNFPKLY